MHVYAQHDDDTLSLGLLPITGVEQNESLLLLSAGVRQETFILEPMSVIWQ